MCGSRVFSNPVTIVFCRCCFGYNIQLSGLKPWLALVWLCHCRYNAMPINQSHHHACSLCLTNQILLPTPLNHLLFLAKLLIVQLRTPACFANIPMFFHFKVTQLDVKLLPSFVTDYLNKPFHPYVDVVVVC